MHPRRQPLDEFGLDIAVDEDALRRDANLASVIVAALDDRLDDPVEPSAAVDDDRRRTPCSSAQRVPGASLLRRYQPTRAEPMKLRKAMRGSVASRSDRALSSVTRVWHHGSGRPASRSRATSFRQDSGVGAAGLTITGHPTAMAGAT